MSFPGKCCILIYATCLFLFAARPAGFVLLDLRLMLGAMILGLVAVCLANVCFQIDRRRNDAKRIAAPNAPGNSR